jgi:hypothetical protein
MVVYMRNQIVSAMLMLHQENHVGSQSRSERVEIVNCGKQAGSNLLCLSCEVIISVKPDALWRQRWPYLKHGTSPSHKNLGSDVAKSNLVLCDIGKKVGRGGMTIIDIIIIGKMAPF